MRIALFISSLQAGGAERVLSEMANYWERNGLEVHFITLSGPESDFYPLNLGVRRVSLHQLQPSAGALSAVANNIRRVMRLRRELARMRPDVMVSFMDRTNVLALIAGAGLVPRIVVSERADLRHHNTGRLWSALRGALYPRAHGVVVQTEALRTWMAGGAFGDRVICIPNPVSLPVPGTCAPPRSGQRAATIVAMGRLAHQKGMDILLRAFAALSAEFPGWTLTILGEGPERASLGALADSLGVHGRVVFLGLTRDPEIHLARASLFVLASRYEGFPNALLEAMACGTAVISTDCPSGPAEIIRHGIDGLLVPNEDVGELANAMRTLIAHSELRERLGKAAASVQDRFGVRRVMGLWEAALGI